MGHKIGWLKDATLNTGKKTSKLLFYFCRVPYIIERI